MAPSKLWEALGAVKDQTSIGLARVGCVDEVAADLDVAIVKATGHGESLPADERHVQEILTLTRYSRARVAACVASVSRRLGRTRAWAVAVKTLALVHRLLTDGDPAYEQEVFLATTRRGRRLLDMSRFRDRSSSRALDLSAFVRGYAAYLHDRLKHRMPGRGGGVATPGKWRLGGRRDSFDDTDERYEMGEAVADAWAPVPRPDTPDTETTTEELFAKAHHLKHLLDRFVACRPTGKARTNTVVTAALYTPVKESAVMYRELTEVMAMLIDRFAEMETTGCVRVHSILTSLAELVDELDEFYSWCKATAVCRPSDIPEVEHVTQKKLDLMDEFIRNRQASASQRRRSLPSSPVPSIPLASRATATKYDTDATKPRPAKKEREEKNSGKAAPAEPAGSLIVVDDHMADFLNVKEDTTPLSGDEHGRKLALALFCGDQAEPVPKWETFDDPSSDWEAALVQSASTLDTRRGALGGGFNFNTTVLDGVYSHAAANATATNAHAFAGSASSVAMRPPGATVLALPAMPGASAAGAARVDLFAASLAVPPPAYVQITDMQTRQRLLVEEQMVWQQFEKERQRPAWSYSNLNLL